MFERASNGPLEVSVVPNLKKNHVGINGIMNPAPSPMRPFIPENFNNTLRLFFCCDPFSTLLGEITSRYPLNSDHKRPEVARHKKENTTMKSWCTVSESSCKDRSNEGTLE